MRKDGGEKQYDPNVWPYRNFHLFVYINLNILKKRIRLFYFCSVFLSLIYERNICI